MAVIPNKMKEEARSVATDLQLALYELDVECATTRITRKEAVEKYKNIARHYVEDITRVTARILIFRAIERSLKAGHHD